MSVIYLRTSCIQPLEDFTVVFGRRTNFLIIFNFLKQQECKIHFIVASLRCDPQN